MKKSILKSTSLVLVLSAMAGCTTNHPIAYGSLAGAAGGAGVGAIVAANSASITNGQGIGYGAIAGIPIGIAAAYISDNVGKHMIIDENNDAITTNYQTIYDNQAMIDQLRYETFMERPRGNPDPDLAEYIYLGPKMGNPWR
jgi:hypothetical protein